MRILLFSLLAISAIGLFAVPGVFADHDEITIQNAQGSSTPGCEPDCFIPSVVTLSKADTEVTWENNDNAAHTSTSGSAADGVDGLWDSGLVMAGGSYTKSFEGFSSGSYDYHCMVHPWMEGTIIIEDDVDSTPPTVTVSAYLNATSPTGRTFNVIVDDQSWEFPEILSKGNTDLGFLSGLLYLQPCCAGISSDGYGNDNVWQTPIPANWEPGTYYINWSHEKQVSCSAFSSSECVPIELISSFSTSVVIPALPAEPEPELDIVPPQVLVPDDIIIETDNQNGSTVTFNPQAIDNIDELLTPVCNYTTGSTFPVGTTVVTCTATDEAGNTGTGTFVVTITYIPPPDTISPIVNVPSNITYSTSSISGYYVSFAVTASDNIGIISGPICSQSSGSTFPVGTTVVTCTATDEAGNTGSNSFNITIEFIGILIPDWIKEVAGFWHMGDINDNSFLLAIAYLIDNNIIVIPATEAGSGGGTVPEWVKNTAGWWADDQIDDETFVNAIQYLIKEGLIQV